jgi:adenosylcobinamide-GDP ribazoletransferase
MTAQVGERGGFWGRWRAAPLLAVSFLTTLPVPAPARFPAGSMGTAVALFPIVGAGVGAALWLADLALSPWLPGTVVAALLVAGLLLLSGALHLDGLMDSFDGLFGGKDAAARLAIMRDSRVGSFGIAAAGSVLLVEYACLASLSGDSRGPALVVAACLSRWATAATLWSFPAATSTGLAAGLKPELSRHHLLLATGSGLAVAVVAMGAVGAGVAAASALLVAAGGRFATARLGGITGDSCGALGQLVEVMVLVLLLAAL